MANRYPLSPLLQPRPPFRGVRHSGDIFLHFSTLSGITTVLGQYPAVNDHNNPDEIDDDNPDIIFHSNPDLIEQNNPNTNEIDQSPQAEQTSTHGEEKAASRSTGTEKVHVKTTVIDRRSDNTETLAEYTLNEKTVDLFKQFGVLRIEFETEIYKPREMRSNVNPNTFYCKNLFLKDRKGQYYLVICHEDFNIDLKMLRKQVNAYRNFNFVNGEEMSSILQVDPGAVTPLALMLSTADNVQMVIHNSLLSKDATCRLMFHPMDSELAIKLSTENLLRFLRHCNHSFKVVK